MNNKKEFVSIEQAVPRIPEIRFREPVQWQIGIGEQWAVIGPNGSGKTILADLLQRRYALKDGEVRFGIEGKTHEIVKSIAFKDIHTLADQKNTYYQQRWHATETDELPTVESLLGNTSDDVLFGELQTIFNIKEHLQKKIIHLSSGELRKFLIIRTLLSDPKLLILDNPFIGLDVESRGILMNMLEQLVKLKNLQVILLLSNPDDIPEMITHVLPVINRKCYNPVSSELFRKDKVLQRELFPVPDKLLQLPQPNEASSHQTTVQMEKVSVKYGSRTILKDVDWTIKNGEKWALCGPNGSGKSLLLSLIYADNPQACAQKIYLFDRKRGTGESIWDIKKRIGYVSPEIHLYYMENVPASDIVCSGFFDSIGLSRKCDAVQREIAIEWMSVFGIEQLKERSFLSLSSGEQRLILLARAFVKDPDLIILDEPLHGLDISNKQRVSNIIEHFCMRENKTLIYVTHYLHELPNCVTKQLELVKLF